MVSGGVVGMDFTQSLDSKTVSEHSGCVSFLALGVSEISALIL